MDPLRKSIQALSIRLYSALHKKPKQVTETVALDILNKTAKINHNDVKSKVVEQGRLRPHCPKKTGMQANPNHHPNDRSKSDAHYHYYTSSSSTSGIGYDSSEASSGSFSI